MLTFTRTKTWDQQVAECPNTIQVFNNCVILKSFAVYTATPDFGDMPLLYARHIQLVTDKICICLWLMLNFAIKEQSKSYIRLARNSSSLCLQRTSRYVGICHFNKF